MMTSFGKPKSWAYRWAITQVPFYLKAMNNENNDSDKLDSVVSMVGRGGGEIAKRVRTIFEEFVMTWHVFC